MKHVHASVVIALLITGCSEPISTPPKQTQLNDRIGMLVSKYFPEVRITQDNGKLSAKHGTTVFTIHRHWKTGQIQEGTDRVEGPNYKGFMISISVKDGKYEGQAVVPQTLNRRYWQEYIDRPPTEDGKGHYVINLAYGSQLDRDFKKAVFEALP